MGLLERPVAKLIVIIRVHVRTRRKGEDPRQEFCRDTVDGGSGIYESPYDS